MSQVSSLIYEINNLKKIYNDHEVINIRQLKFHRGTIYGIVGPCLLYTSPSPRD